MKKEATIEVITHGTPHVGALAESEAKAFYATLLARILELRRQQLSATAESAETEQTPMRE